MKIQLNLYDHREKDKEIMQKLGLTESTNPNALVKDLLYKLAMNIDIKPVETAIKPKPIVRPKEENIVNNKLLSGMQGLL